MDRGTSRESLLPDSSKSRQKMCTTRKQHALTARREGLSKNALYGADLFHTLLHIPKGRFCLLFFATYLFQYIVFAYFYWIQAEGCIKGVMHFLHALWFSVQTSTTIGYGGQLTPDPYCSITNALVTCQVIVSLLIDYAMLGIVFTRFANPSARASTIRFSKQMAMTQQDGQWRLTFRVANIRKHQILRPEIRVLLLSFKSRHPEADPAGYLVQELGLSSGGSTHGRHKVWLGLPISMSHIIDDDSPLHGMMPIDMDKEDTELLVLLDGVDATTSGILQARWSYLPTDIQLNHHFHPMTRRAPDGMLTIDFGCFDLLSGSGTTADLETGQTSELASFADGTPLASGNAPDHGSKSELKGSRQNGSAIPEPHARLQNLQRLCAELHSDSEITGSVRDACAALQSRIDAEIR